MKAARRLCICTLLAGVLLAGNAQMASASEVSEALERDREIIASGTGATEEELRRRYALADPANEILAAIRPLTGYAGMWVSDTATRLNIAVSGGPHERAAVQERVQAHLSEIEDQVTVTFHEVPWTQVDLLETLELLQEIREVEGMPNADFMIPIDRNYVTVAVEHSEDVQDYRTAVEGGDQRLQPVAEGGAVRYSVGGVSEPAYRGGHPTTSCTAGFVVQGSGGAHGFMTAAHWNNDGGDCRTTAPYQGHNTSLEFWYLQDHKDVSVHRMHGGTPLNEIAIDTDPARQITSTSGYHDLEAGVTPVCKHGRRTGSNCGWVTHLFVSPNWIPNGSNLVRSSHVCYKGDSGGPVFFQNDAIGIVAGYFTDGSFDCIFGAQDLQLQGTGWSIKTSAK